MTEDEERGQRGRGTFFCLSVLCSLSSGAEMLTFRTFLWQWFKTALLNGWKGHGYARALASAACFALLAGNGVHALLTGKPLSALLAVPPDLKPWVDWALVVVPGAFLLVALIDGALSAPYDMHKRMSKGAEEEKWVLRSRIETLSGEVQKAKAEIAQLLSEQQPLELTAFVNHLKFPAIADIHLGIRNPSRITAARNVFCEFSEMRCVSVAGTQDSFVPGHKRRNEHPYTVNPETALHPCLLRLKTFADGNVIQIDTTLDNDLLMAGTLLAAKSTYGKPLFNEFTFKVGVSAMERPRSVETFKVTTERTSETTYHVSVVKEIPNAKF